MENRSLRQEKEFTRRLLTITQWPKYHSWPSSSGLRHLIFYSKKNGFEKVIRRAGKRVLIDESAFFQWIDQRNEAQEKNEIAVKK